MIFSAPDPFDQLKQLLPDVQNDGTGTTLTFVPHTVGDAATLFEQMTGESLGDYLPQAFLAATTNLLLTGYGTFDQQDTKQGLSLTRTDTAVYRLAFALVWTKQIQLDDAITLHNPSVAIAVTYSQAQGVSVAGVISSGKLVFQELNLDLNVSVQVPSLIINASLGVGRDAAGAASADLASQHLGASGTDVIIHDIRFMAAPHVKNYLLHISVSNLLNLHDKFRIGLLQAEISYRGGLGASNYAVRVYTDLEIGFDEQPLSLAISGEFEKQGGATRWRLAGYQTRPITVSQMMQDLANLFQENGAPADNPYHLPEFIADTTLDHLGIEVAGVSGGAMGSSEYIFTLGLSVPVGERDLKLEIYARYARSGAAYTLTLTGSLILEGFALAVAFSKSADSQKSDTTLLGSLQTPLKLDATDLIRAISPSLADDVPISVSIELLGLLLAMHSGSGSGAQGTQAGAQGRVTTGAQAKQQAQRDYLFRLLFNLNFGLDGLPLVGKMLEGVGFREGQLLAANRDWQNDDLGAVNDLLTVIEPSPPPIGVPQQANATIGVGKGITLSGRFQITKEIGFPLFLQFGGGKQQSRLTDKAEGKQPKDDTTKPAQQRTGQPDARSQTKIDKVISAVRIKKVGLIFENGRIGIKITGGLALAVFEFELIGMQVTVPQSVLDDPSNIAEIDFALDGFAAEIRKGTLSIMGAFLRQHFEAYNENGKLIAYDEFSGIIQLSFPPFSLTGMGSYAMYDDHPSLFLFVALGFPITIGPVLVIEGLALGFGIHRDFIPPELDAILTYPLVAVAVTPPPAIDITEMVQKLHDYFPPAADLYFVVVGVKFKAFALVDSLVMVAVKFGREFELTLIGVSSILLPAVFIELVWMARFVPKTGYLFIGGQLTERSFLLVPQVHLTGGFAVAVWGAGQYKGDFVVSVGGYHPHFSVPDHYPNHIPRLGISFHLGPADLKGGVYFAITPQCVMMGAFLEASVKQGALHAFIKLAFDAIIYFQPFHYDVMISADAGVKVDIPLLLTTLHINVHLHLDVHIWGPEFSGTASIDVGPKTFDVAIGEGASPSALPLQYETFKEKFLPTVCTVSVTEGLARKAEENGVEIYVVDAEKVVIEARSTIPITAGVDDRLGITPMDVRGKGFTATHSLRASDNFRAAEIKDAVPTGIWGGVGLQKPNLGDPASGLVHDVHMGYRLRPGAERETSESHAIEKEKLAYNTDTFTLKDRAVTVQMGEYGRTDVQKPTDSYFAYTGLHLADISQIDADHPLPPNLLAYALQ